MLDLAIKYKDQLENLQYETWFKEKYKYWNLGSYYDTLEVDNSTWYKHQFVPVVNGKVIGYIAYNISRPENSVSSLNIINYSDNKIVFGKDLIQALRDIFEKYNFRKLKFDVVIGNPIEKSYDRLIKKYGGRIIGVCKEDVKLFDGKYYDKKEYEILAEDYFNVINNK